MKIQTLFDKLSYNFKITAELSKKLNNPFWSATATTQYYLNVIQQINKSKKFSLPENGFLLQDYGFTQLKETDIRLPYSNMLLEFSTTNKEEVVILIHQADDKSSKIRVAAFMKKPDEIDITTFKSTNNTWLPIPMFSFDPVEYMNTIPSKDNPQAEGKFVVYRHKDYTPFPDDYLLQHASNHIFVIVCTGILDFLNSYAAKIVHTVDCSLVKKRTTMNKRSKKAKVVESKIEYVLVTVPREITQYTNRETSHPTNIEERFRPHEHIREAHWRHYKSGKSVRIPDLIINKGIKPRVEKVYVVKPKEEK